MSTSPARGTGHPDDARPDDDPQVGTDRADRLAARLAVPVLIAALASVPAVFLTLLQDPWETVGSGINTVSGVVLIAETVVLFAVAEDRRAWLRRNRWLVALAIAIVPAVLFTVGPVQLLRLARVAGALRILRVGRIFKAGRIVRERAGLDHGWQRAVTVLVTVLCASFVAVVLADPTSTSRSVLEQAVDLVGVPGILVAGLILAGATWLVVSDRQPGARAREREDPPDRG
jgi:CsoR family transcriptional regulator, copper-sensing transcriptional repressor